MNPISLADLLNTPDAQHSDLQWLIPDLLPLGLTVLHGGARIGKSWLTLHLALSVALGTPALEHLPTTQTDVLYLGLQDTPQRIARRTHKLLGTQPAPNNFLWSDQWPSPSTEQLDKDSCTGLIYHTPINEALCTGLIHHTPIDTLDLWLAAHPHTRLVVIDSLQDLSWNTNAQPDLPLLQQLKTLADKYHIAILVTNQHMPTTKRNSWNEHTYDANFAIADATITLKRERCHSDATLSLTGPDIPDQELALTLPKDTMIWTLLGPAHDYHLSQERQDILALLEEHRDGPLRPKQIAALLHKDVRAVTKLLFDMSHSSQIRLLGRGQYMTIKTNTPSNIQQSQSYPSYLGNLDQIFASTDSNGGNIGNDSNLEQPNQSCITNDTNNSNDSNGSNIGSDGNYPNVTPTDFPSCPYFDTNQTTPQ